MNYSNYHTHSVFCDGQDSPEALVQQAIRLGCPELGFSGHSHLPFDDCTMSREGTEEYKRSIRALKEKYRGEIKILLGIEQDIYSTDSAKYYDYVIGAVHHVLKNGAYLPVDLSPESQQGIVRDCYGGDYYAFAEDYYDTLGRVYDATSCDIIAHFDLITKFNEGGALFDTAHPRYRRAALGALERLMDSPAAFEINTGAMARGYRSSPYPEQFILDALKARGKRLLLSSDCHSREKLLYGFEEAAKLL